MKLLEYLRYSAWDYVLCALMTTGLTINVFQAFYLPAALAGNGIWLLVMTLSVFLILFLCSYNKKTIAISIIAFVAVVILVLFYIKGNQIFATLSTDPEANGHVYYTILIFFALLVYLLSRTRTGAVLLFVLGAYILAAVVFLGYEHFFWGFLLFIWASATMPTCKIYQYNVLHTITVKTSFAAFFAIAGLLTALVVGMGFNIYVTQIEPLDLPTRELKLITRLQSLEVLEKTGVSSKRILIDPEQSTRHTDDTKRTSQNQDQADKPETHIESSQPEQTLPDYRIDPMDPGDDQKSFYAIRYIRRLLTYHYLMIAAPLAIAIAILGKLLMRRHWYRKTLQQSKKNQVINFYHFYLQKFRWLGLEKRESDTPSEYVCRSARRLNHFTQGAVNMERLTDIYIKANYGDIDVNDAEYELYISFYREFYKNCKVYLGSFRYALSFFVL